MAYTLEMAHAEKNLQKAMRDWKIVQQENPRAGAGVFIDQDTRQNGSVVTTRMEYVRNKNGLEVTRITQGNRLIYGLDARGTCHESDTAITAFFEAQPQMEAVFTTVSPMMFIAYNQCKSSSR